MKAVLFSDPWYQDFVSQEVEAVAAVATPETAALCRAVLSGFAMVAQSLDRAFGEQCEGPVYDGNGTARDALLSLEAAIDRAGEAIADSVAASRR